MQSGPRRTDEWLLVAVALAAYLVLVAAACVELAELTQARGW